MWEALGLIDQWLGGENTQNERNKKKTKQKKGKQFFEQLFCFDGSLFLLSVKEERRKKKEERKQ